MDFIVKIATEQDTQYAPMICQEMAESAKARGTGIAKRSPEYLEKQMRDGKAIIAMTANSEVAGFCYIEAWQGKKYTANSGLIVFPAFREFGLARMIKLKAFELSRQKYPEAKLFGLTTSAAVMKINSKIGYRPTTFSELTQDDEFWKGCQSCVNYQILQSKDRKNCLCTAMIYDPKENVEREKLAKKNLSTMEKIRKLKARWFKKD